MIYDAVQDSEPIRQGDIFISLPRVDLDLGSLLVAGERGAELHNWADIEAGGDGVSLLLQARPVAAIVISQDCDAGRAEDVSLCEIRPFHSVERRAADQADKPKKWVSLVTQHARMNQKWFYLPRDDNYRITERMAVDFRVVLQLGVRGLESVRASNRVGRLNNVAGEHFRERLAEFFRRYAYDEWYPLERDEFAHYVATHQAEDVQPFPWQNQQ
ncbi:hypothetical protein [Amycolatopsis sp. WAC 01376]|uniref:hypothetical protein n=1 Tax=Amycolatopsis sp. WAC 01376 TaxID=2203195 RepID=UPI000F7AEDB3|nr:hypothetical protein [Amycolatopsis sp. WAC 01376]